MRAKAPRPLLAAVLAVAAATQGQAQWRVSVSTDRLTDEQTATFRLDALEQTRGAAGLPFRPSLLFRCSDGEITDLWLSVGAVVDERTAVQFRFDRDPALEEAWGRSTNHTALFSPKPGEFVDSLLLHRRLVVRYEPYAENSQVTSFSLGTLVPHDRVLRKHCGFTVVEQRAEIRATNERRREQAVADSAVEAEQSRAALKAAERADSIRRLGAGSRDSTLPWVSAISKNLYYRNTPECRKALDVHPSWLLFWSSEEAVQGTKRMRSPKLGC